MAANNAVNKTSLDITNSGIITAATFNTINAATSLSISGTTISAVGSDTNINVAINVVAAVIVPSITLSADSLAVPYGGTGGATWAAHGILYCSVADTTLTTTSVGSDMQILTASTVNDAPRWLAAPSKAGLFLLSTGTASDPVWGYMYDQSWTEETGTTHAMVFTGIQRGLVMNNASQVVATLPSSCAYGTSLFVVAGLGSGGWRIAQNSGQTIRVGTSVSTSGASGYIESTGARDCVTLVCIASNAGFVAISYNGTITVV